jgi:two-component sensor histidine kinase
VDRGEVVVGRDIWEMGALLTGRKADVYLGKLVGGFEGVYHGVPVHLEVGDDRITLDVDRAIHVGLMVNELVTNAFKHAFPPGGSGEVAVRLHRLDDTVEVQVRDTGKGLPEKLDIEHARTLGLRIVHILAQRLRASVQIENDNGATFTIRFPLHTDAPIEPREA